MATIYINDRKSGGHINAEIQGQFSEHLGRGIYEGLFVREDSGIENVNGMRTDVVGALKEMGVPLLRWPGGCFADEYHWKDGIGPRAGRKKMINTHWGGVIEDNSFGTHEFFELCRQLGCRTYVNGNVGSGTVQEMSEWVEYMTFDGVSPMADLRRKNAEAIGLGDGSPWKVDYFGVGNENWGCGGNMRPTYYGDLYRRFQTYIRQYHPDQPIKKVCGGPNVADTIWTKKVLDTCFDHPQPAGAHGFMDGLSLHYYVHPGGWLHKGSATNFDDGMYLQSMARALYMEELINMHGAIMDQYDPEKEIGLIVDEWGGWYDVEPGTNPGFLYQQNTMRDALIAAATLNIFNNHCDRVKMACIAQMINVIQSVILTDGPDMILTPTYHVFHQFKAHQDAELLPSYIDGNEILGEASVNDAGDLRTVPALQVSASQKDGAVTVTIANMDLEKSFDTELAFAAFKPASAAATVVTSGDVRDHNTFENPDAVAEKPLENVTVNGQKVTLHIPACSVVAVTLR